MKLWSSSLGKVSSVNERPAAGSATRALLHYIFKPLPEPGVQGAAGETPRNSGVVTILTLGMLSLVQIHSESSRSLISHAKIEGHSRLYSAIF